MPPDAPMRIYAGLGLVALAGGGLLGLGVAAEVANQISAGLSSESWSLFAGGLRTRVGAGFPAAVGVASLSTAMAWSGRRLAALVPGLLLYMFPAVVVQIATGGEVGWLIRVPATEWWALPAVAAEAGLMFGPVLVPGGGSRISAAERALALGLIGTPAITMAWLLAVFTGPTVLDVAVMCASAIAVLAAGVLSDPSLTPALWLAALGTAVTVRAIDLGASWPAVATLCLAAGVIAAGAAPQLWAGRHRRMRLGFLGV